ncbi:MAG TPA: GNAT family N-acetyltransferase [Planctomycetes bacterium]|nr:GNAT family N-acetyltransferase [Planctomycetota bacterium]
MNLRLRSIESHDEALRFAPDLGRGLLESYPAASPELSGEELASAFLEAHRGAAAMFFLVAEGEAGTLAVAATAPWRDPVTLQTSPMLVALWVDPAIRHRGVARELVRELRRLVARHGFSTLLGRVPTGDDALLGMAERWGMVREQELVAARLR